MSQYNSAPLVTPSDEKSSLSDRQFETLPHVAGLSEIKEAAEEGRAVLTDGHGHALLAVDHAAEAKLRLKMDIRILPMIYILYLTFIGRTNIGNARLAGLETDLGLVGTNFNVVLTSFYVGYVAFEIPSNIACKYFGPARWIPFLVTSFGILTICMAFVQNYASIIIVRLLIGAFQGGMQPGLAFYLSRFYSRPEIVFRIAAYILAGPTSGMFGGALAYGLLSINGIGSIFLVEGIVTAGIGLIAFFIMTDTPASAGWLNAEEKALAAIRIKRESPATTSVAEGLRKKLFLRGLFNWNAALVAWIFFLDAIAVQGIAVFLPTLIRALYPGLTTLQQQARTIPPYVVGAAAVMILPFISWKINRRAIMMMLTAPLGVIGYALLIGGMSPNVKFVGLFFVISGVYPFGAYCLAYGGANVSPDNSRAGAIALVSFGGNLGGLVSTWTYLPRQAPNYYPGNGIGLTCCALMVLFSGIAWFYQVRENKIREAGGRDHRLDGLSPDEVALLGSRHPEFRYTY